MNDSETRRNGEPARRGPSQRRMTRGRRLYYFLGLPLLRFLLFALAASYRKQPVPDSADFRRAPDAGGTLAPCYWHQHHVLCSWLIRSWLRRGFRAAFLISDSVDGEVPARIARAWGAQVIRGSANRTGAAALRDMRTLVRDGVSIVTTADGPLGPKYEFKGGVVLMARLTGAHLVPLACAAEKAWYLRRWDNFMIPKPFSRVAIGIGDPIVPGRGIDPESIEADRQRIETATMDLMRRCEESLQR